MLHHWIFKPCLITMKFEMIENLFVQVEQRKYLVALTKIQLHDKLHEKDQFEIDHAWILYVQFLLYLPYLCNKQCCHCLHYYPKTKWLIQRPCYLYEHREKFPVAWYWKLRNELRCFSEYLQEPTTRCMVQLVLFL